MKVCRAFSLVEVMVATGVFAAGVVTAIALLASTADAARSALESRVAVRVAESTRALLAGLPWGEAMAWVDAGTPRWVDQEGILLGIREMVTEADAFYAVEVHLNERLPATVAGTEPGWRAVEIRVSWPVRDDAGRPQPLARRQVVVLSGVIRR